MVKSLMWVKPVVVWVIDIKLCRDKGFPVPDFF
jgi:hypothetical protein